jgi:alpha-maltose-1-phosphate synthase
VKAAIFTREYPPDVYGGAGVHVEYLARELRALIEVEVRAFGDDRDGARGFQPCESVKAGGSALETLSVDLAMAADVDASIAHSHTWYANMGGHLAKLLHGIPHVLTTHSLEPSRPWKEEQLGHGGYALSSWCERTAIEAADAVIAVSTAMREDVERFYPAVDPERIHVIHNGIDPEQYSPDRGTDVLETYGVDPTRPIVLFVGRTTRQKGVTGLLEAALEFDPAAQLVLCAGAADTEELLREVEAGVELLRERRDGVFWIEKMLEKREVIQLLTHATVFCVPSVYEPMGIVNLEAMACETAVVASRVGGIPDVVADGETGYLVDLGDSFPHEFAARVNELLRDPERARRFGEMGRQRVLEHFTWRAVAEKTARLYQQLVA